jgi:hypothetical protein
MDAKHHDAAAHRRTSVSAMWKVELAPLAADRVAVSRTPENRVAEQFRRLGMSIAVNADARVKTVTVTDDLITFHLVDGRVISVPLVWSWRLSDATPAQRNNYEIIGDGQGVHSPDVDEDLSVEGMFNGVPARRPKKPSAG